MTRVLPADFGYEHELVSEDRPDDVQNGRDLAGPVSRLGQDVAVRMPRAEPDARNPALVEEDTKATLLVTCWRYGLDLEAEAIGLCAPLHRRMRTKLGPGCEERRCEFARYLPELGLVERFSVRHQSPIPPANGSGFRCNRQR